MSMRMRRHGCVGAPRMRKLESLIYPKIRKSLFYITFIWIYLYFHRMRFECTKKPAGARILYIGKAHLLSGPAEREARSQVRASA